MTEPDRLTLAAAERAIIEALDPVLFVDGIHTISEETAATLTAYRTAKRRVEVFEQKAQERC